MKKLILLVVLGGLLLVGVAGVVLMLAQGLHPLKVVRDALTGYQSGHARHQFDPSEAVRWDPIGDHNAAVAAMSPDERAYPLVAEAMARLRAMRDETWGDRPDARLPDFIRAKPGEPEWERLKTWLEEEPVREVLAIVRQAAGRPALGQPLGVRDDPEWIESMARHGIEIAQEPSPVPSDPLLLDVLLTGAGAIRDMCRLCLAQAELATEQGDAQAFRGAVQDLFGLAPLTSEPGFVLNQLLRIAVLMMAADRIADAIMHHPDLLDEGMAARFDAMLADALAMGWTDMNLTVEQTVFEDILRRMMNDQGVFDPMLSGLAVSGMNQPGAHTSPPPSAAPLTAFNTDLLACYRRMEMRADAGVAALEIPWQPYAIRGEEFESWLAEPDSIAGRIGRLMVGILAVDWSVPARTFRTARQDIIGLRVALAAHRHQLRHGEAPASLDAIDADLLTFDPVDGFTGGRLVYRWTDDSHLVYALGADGDDDGGRHATDPDGTAVRAISDDYLRGKWDGDWIIFPSHR